MNRDRIIEALRGTTRPEEQAVAAEYLNQTTKIVEFGPILLQAVMDDKLEAAVRQAGIIYLKNMIVRFWEQKSENHHNEATTFTIHEQDRHIIRENIVEAIIHSPEPIRVQLGVCVQTILRNDFPDRWPDIVPKIGGYLTKIDGPSWMGALLVLYRLVKIFDYGIDSLHVWTSY